MPDIYVVEGDKKILDLVDEGTRVTIIDSTNKSQFLIQNINKIDEVKLIDSYVIKDIEFIVWCIRNSKYPLVIMFSDGKIPKEIKALKKIPITYIKGKCPEKVDLFPLLDKIMYEKDRLLLYNQLEGHASKYSIMLMFLIGNAFLFDEQNQKTLMDIDELGMNKNAQITRRLLAFGMKPVGKRIFLKWRFAKNEK